MLMSQVLLGSTSRATTLHSKKQLYLIIQSSIHPKNDLVSHPVNENCSFKNCISTKITVVPILLLSGS